METLKEYILSQVADKQLSVEKAATYLQEIQQPLDIRPHKTEHAIIGMACRFPGADTPHAFWENLFHRRDCISAFPKNRIDDVKYVNQHTYDSFNGFQCRVGGYLDRIDLFDHTFFKITPAEARVMDPSQRIFLEVAAEALDSAGLTEENLRGSNTGIFVGCSINEDNYIDILSKDDPNIALGNQSSVLAYRLSFLYDMRGPTMVIDTACSSSLVAVHQACLAITEGDCDQAILGGVNIRIFPAVREISNLGIEAFDGRCKTFDEKANGTNIGDGVAAIVVKRRDLAEKDGDYIYAIIKGSAVNSDGNANGITAPNPEAQAAVLQAAWKKAHIHPEEISFKLGSEVIYLQFDVTHFASCQNLITTLEKKWGTISGIFVAIKNISHKRLEDISFEEFSSNILAKVQGTWLLDDLTKHLPVDFMATFSSISSLTGGPTGADCSASNLFLDSFGNWRNDQERSTITMNYTLIEADDGSLLSDRMSMIPPLSKEEFLGCLELCLIKK